MSRLSTSIIGRTWDEWRHRRLQSGGDTEDFLLVTWDSCRHDTFERARTPVLDGHTAARRAWAMATYTLPAHQAMFNGFLPHVFEPFFSTTSAYEADRSPLGRDGMEMTAPIAEQAHPPAVWKPTPLPPEPKKKFKWPWTNDQYD